MDRIIAVYANDYVASLVYQRFFYDGFPIDRIDVVTWDDSGRQVDHPALSREQNRLALFSKLLPDDGELPVIRRMVRALRDGQASVIVQPRGSVEIGMAREILRSQQSEVEVWRVDRSERQGGLLSQRAASG